MRWHTRYILQHLITRWIILETSILNDLCLPQAISLIVTHRTDDMSKLPPVITTEVLKKPNQAAGRRQLPTYLPCACGENIALLMAALVYGTCHGLYYLHLPHRDGT